jgi:predicted DNA binding protein
MWRLESRAERGTKAGRPGADGAAVASNVGTVNTGERVVTCYRDTSRSGPGELGVARGRSTGWKMRYFDLVLTPGEHGIHPADGRLAAAPGVSRQLLHHLDAYTDGTGALLYRLQGDREAAIAAVEGEGVLDFDTTDPDEEGRFYCYVHIEYTEPVGTLLRLGYDHALIIETPIRFRDDGSLRVRIVGQHETLREALTAIPDGVRVTVEEVGRYTPGRQDARSLLTDRQREIFETAVERGYYRIPRGITQTQLADELDLAPSTVDEHLRKAESTMLSSILDEHYQRGGN